MPSLVLAVITDRPRITLDVKRAVMPDELPLMSELSIETASAADPFAIGIPLKLLLLATLFDMATVVDPPPKPVLVSIPLPLLVATTWSMTPFAVAEPLGGR